MTQKKDIKRQKDRLEALKKEAEEERARAREAARERVLREFERGQLGLAGGSNTSATTSKPAESKTDEREWNWYLENRCRLTYFHRC